MKSVGTSGQKKCSITYQNGSNYIGECIKEGKDNKKHGKGTYTFKNGTYLFGEWRNDKLNGKGFYYNPKIGNYEGDFMDNLKHGQGKFYWFITNETYIGEWKNDLKNGKGSMKFANGSTYEAEWLNDKILGKYKLVSLNMHEPKTNGKISC